MRKITYALLIIALFFLFTPTTSKAATNIGEQMADIAKNYKGIPYLFGGSTINGFDCSGFTQFIYKQFEIDLPRTAADQYNKGIPVEATNLQTGDLVFYSNTYKNGISHVGIYIGNNEFISATSNGVKVYPLDNPYWSPKYTGAKRLLQTEESVVPAVPIQFSDLENEHYAYSAIQMMTAQGVISGYIDGTFRPEEAITRGQAAAIINRALHYTPKSLNSFKDVQATNRFAKDIAAMKELKIMSGFTDGTFRPDQTLTRAEMAVMVVKAFQVKKVSISSIDASIIYSDVYSHYWAYDSILTLHSIDKTSGFKTNTYRPTDHATRADLTAAVYSSN